MSRQAGVGALESPSASVRKPGMHSRRAHVAWERIVVRPSINCEADVVARRRYLRAVDSVSRSAHNHPDGGDREARHAGGSGA